MQEFQQSCTNRAQSKHNLVKQLMWPNSLQREAGLGNPHKEVLSNHAVCGSKHGAAAAAEYFCSKLPDQ